MNKLTAFKEIIKFVLRLVHRLGILVAISIPLQLIGAIFIIPILILRYDIGSFPTVCRYWDSADPYIGRDISVITRINTLGYWSKYCWVAWRNPCNYFEYKVLGIHVNDDLELTQCYGDPETGDSTNDHPGLYYIEVMLGSNYVYYEYYYIHKFSNTTCFRFRLGWKIGRLSDNRPGSYIQQVLVLQPYRSYAGV